MIVMGGQTMSKPDLVYKCPRLSSRFPQGSGGTAFKSNDSVFFQNPGYSKNPKINDANEKGKVYPRYFKISFILQKLKSCRVGRFDGGWHQVGCHPHRVQDHGFCLLG
jgi:hypothetical protein